MSGRLIGRMSKSAVEVDMRRNVAIPVSLMVAMLALSRASSAQPAFRARPGAAPGTVALPYRVGADAMGNQWMVYNGGWVRQQGNMMALSEVAVLMINGAGASTNTNQARLDGDQVVLENMNAGGCMVTRRIGVEKDGNYLRVLDVLKNPTNQPQTYNVMYRTSVNYGIQNAAQIPDPKRKDQNIGIVVTDGQGRGVTEIFAGRGSKLAPSLAAQPNGNNYIQTSLSVPVPAGKEVALLHLHTVTPTADAGQKFAAAVKESKLLASLPTPLRKMVANFAGGLNFIGDTEVLRGDVFDVIELRGGDQFRGTLKEPSYKLVTSYGAVELPAERVVGLMNAGLFRPRQLLVTADGEIFGGTLEKKDVRLDLSNGQSLQIPVGQVLRLGYRRRAGEPEEWTLDKPMVVLRSGDRMGVNVPPGDMEVLTRYGRLKVPASSIAAIVFQPEEGAVHEIHLTDGTRFAGLVAADLLDLTLTGSGQAIKLPASEVTRLQLVRKDPDAFDESSAASLTMVNNDRLVGALQGQLKLDTAFSTITVNASEVRRLSRVADSPVDVQVQLWDESKVSGQLEQSDLDCKLSSGLTVKVPVALVSEYSQPTPQATGVVTDKIKALVADLGAPDWRARDRAEQQLLAMGPVVATVLKQMRATQPAEAQQRIDSILKQVEKAGEKPPANPNPNPPAE